MDFMEITLKTEIIRIYPETMVYNNIGEFQPHYNSVKYLCISFFLVSHCIESIVG